MPFSVPRWRFLRFVVTWLVLWMIPAVAPAASLFSASATDFTIPNGTFETPALPPGPGWAYEPPGAGWTWGTGAGPSKNGTAFTAGSPNAPQGAQILFLQGIGSASRTINFTSGYYVFQF